MDLVESLIFSCAVFLLLVGLIFTASGFGIFVVGRFDGIILIVSGIAMFWGGWIMSGARGFPCGAAAVLNMFDAASTVALWNFEVNPVILSVGPTLFLVAKIASSLTIMLYAKLHSNPRKGGILLSLFYAMIVGWNLSQHFRIYLGLETFSYGIILGAAFSLSASVAVLYFIFVTGHIAKVTIRSVMNKFLVVGLIGLLMFSVYVTWENNMLNNYYDELYELYADLTRRYNKLTDEMTYNMTLLMPKGLDEHYERIRIYESSKFISKGDEGRLVFYVSQVLHDLGDYTYSNYCADFNGTFGTECKQVTADFTTKFLSYVNRTYQNFSRVEQAYNWVNDFVSFGNDTEDFERFPIETIVHRFGDDEDQAVALSFVLEAYGYETALCMLHDGNLTGYGSEGLHHVFCAVRKNGFEYNGTPIALSRYSEYGANWIVLDPAFGHRYGEDPEWMENYRRQDGTVDLPQTIWDNLLVDFDELAVRAEEVGINL
jgi:hypothetical protein